jgi:hypothetical protein
VIIGLEIDSSYLHLLSWEVFDDWDGHTCGSEWCPNDANDHTENPPHENPGDSIVLYLNALSSGETKMIVLDLTVLADSFAVSQTPLIRFYVRSVDDFYSKDCFSGSFTNVGNYQTFNGGDLRSETRHSFVDDELCNGLDDNCDGNLDEGFGVSEPCVIGVGACASEGITFCDEVGGTFCDAVIGEPSPEVCDNGIDDDCNGRTDSDDVACGGDPGPDGGLELGGGPDAGGSPPDDPGGDGLNPVSSSMNGACSCRASGNFEPSRFSLLELLLDAVVL